MYRTVVSENGSLYLGAAARSAGFRPGLVVDVVVTSTGSLIIAVADDQGATLDLAGLVVRPGLTAGSPDRRETVG